MVPVRELQQVEIGIGRHDVARLTANPTAHVHIAISTAGEAGVYREADARVARAACTAAPTRDVEWHRDDVAHIEEFHVIALLDHLAGDLVAEHEPGRRRRATANHMLVRSADVGRDDLEDHRMVDLATMGILKFRISDVPNLDHAWLDIDDTTILAHRITS